MYQKWPKRVDESMASSIMASGRRKADAALTITVTVQLMQLLVRVSGPDEDPAIPAAEVHGTPHNICQLDARLTRVAKWLFRREVHVLGACGQITARRRKLDAPHLVCVFV